MFSSFYFPALFTLFLACTAVSQTPPPCRDIAHGVDLPTNQPLIIAHRGSSGSLPEHTVAAYQKAVDDGADVIECDLAVTLDLDLVCRHESWLSGSTDFSEREEFENRTNTYVMEIAPNIPGVVRDDWFTVDFTLEELKRVRAVQTSGKRDQSKNGEYEIATFDEFLTVAQSSNHTVGLHIELKQPTWVNTLLKPLNTTFEQLVLEKLASYGYGDRSDPCFIQCFFGETLEGLVNQTDLPLVLLLGTPIRDDKLEEIAQLGFYGIGPAKALIANHNTIADGDKNYIRIITDLVDRAHAQGLKVHPFTYKNEASTLAWDYEQDPINEYKLYYQLGVDGYFTDFPATAKRFLTALDCDY